jgi:uncharacterized protein DUF742
MEEPVWIDDDAGPVVRPYALTGGRTRPARDGFDLIAVVVANRPASRSDEGLGSAYAEIMRLCQQPQSVAEIAARLRLPTGTVRVLLGDLVDRELIRKPTRAANLPTDDIFRAVIDGIRAL